MSKLFTGTALMKARQDNHLALDDDIEKFLTDAPFKLNRNKSEPAITFRHLASHTSGISDVSEFICGYFLDGESVENESDFHKVVFADLGQECPENRETDLEGFLTNYFNSSEPFTGYDPGAHFQYNNTATALEGYLIGLATVNSLDQYAKDKIFVPLKMNNTNWNLSELDSENIARPYMYNEETKKIMELPFYNVAHFPATNLKSSANDLGRFMSAIMNGGILDNKRILSETSVDEMLALKRFEDAGGNQELIGIHWRALDEDGEILGHDGKDPGFFSWFGFSPEFKIGIVLLGNGDFDLVDQDHFSKILNLLIEKAERLKQESV